MAGASLTGVVVANYIITTKFVVLAKTFTSVAATQSLPKLNRNSSKSLYGFDSFSVPFMLHLLDIAVWRAWPEQQRRFSNLIAVI